MALAILPPSRPDRRRVPADDARGHPRRSDRREALGRARLSLADVDRDAGAQVFSTRSDSGAATAEIARRAGISEPILYRRFASKRDLYLACLDEAWRRLRTVFEEKLSGGELPAPREFALKLRRTARVLPPNLRIQGPHLGGRGTRRSRAVSAAACTTGSSCLAPASTGTSPAAAPGTIREASCHWATLRRRDPAARSRPCGLRRSPVGGALALEPGVWPVQVEPTVRAMSGKVK